MRIALVGVLLLAAGCSSGSPCGPTNCYGCCDESGVCVTGQVDAACGSAGVRCLLCKNGDTCQRGADSYLCLSPSGSGGGAGGSGGSGGTGGSGGSGGGGSGGGGGNGIVTAGQDNGATWRLCGGGMNYNYSTRSLAGRAGLPAGVGRVQLRYEICIYPPWGNRATEMLVGSPSISPASTKYTTSLQCNVNTSDIPTTWSTYDQWINLDSMQQYEFGSRSISAGDSSGAQCRETVLAWQ